MFQLDSARLSQQLAAAPMEFTEAAKSSAVIISIPRPDGVYERFQAIASPIWEPGFEKNLPGVMTYRGQGIDDPLATVRFDWTPQGFHASVLAPAGAYYVDPWWQGETKTYASYFKKDYRKAADAWRCLVPGSTTSPEAGGVEESAKVANGTTLRQYRLALACTGEYAAVFGGTVPLAQAAMVTAMNRVNQVYEAELAVRMNLVANNSSLVYTNSATDPYTNTDGFAMLDENQATVDSVIGAGNYDIGHVFSTGGGGVASLGCVCQSGLKAQGVTGSDSPVGDAYYIDYVAHEMGHQFGANHTFNSQTDNCGGGNRNAGTAYEIGSGSTIMAYAGICGVDDLQAHSDPYFTHVSLEEIIARFATNTCASTTATGNLPPTVTADTTPLTIPKGTAFTVTASGSDGNSDSLTYFWEQRDLGVAQLLSAADNGTSPIFRSWYPTSSPSRTFPRIQNLINNTTDPAEKYPAVARTLHLRCYARDNRSGGGGIGSTDRTLTITAAAGPFQVTSPNTALVWGSSPQTVTWNVAGTDTNGVNATNVNILLSTDGGNTFPITLASGVPNNGSASVTIPNLSSSTARVRVEGAGNVFWDMSNTNFTVAVSGGAPNVTNVTSSSPDGPYTTGATIPVDISFSSPVAVTGSPRLLLGTTPAEYAGFTAGGGTTTLTFNYIVAAGDNSADLDYSSGAALELNGGTIKDASTSTDALLNLPAPGAAGSLGSNKAIVIDTLAPGVASISAPSVPGTGAGPVSWSVGFTESVTGFDSAADVTLNTTGTVAVGSTTVSGSGAGPYTVTLSSLTGTGTVGFTVNAGVCQDAATNTNLASSPSQTTGVGAVINVYDVDVAEGDSGLTSMTLTLALDPANPGPDDITVDYYTLDGTALAGSDYIAASGTAAFAAGESTTQVTVSIKGDRSFEPDETLTLNLENPTGGASIVTATATGTILNDDYPNRAYALNTDAGGNDPGEGGYIFSPTNLSALSYTASTTLQDALAGLDPGTFLQGGDYAGSDNSVFYALTRLFGSNTSTLISINPQTSEVIATTDVTGIPTGQEPVGMCWDSGASRMVVLTADTFGASTTARSSQLNTINVNTGALTLISGTTQTGATGVPGGTAGSAADPNIKAWGFAIPSNGGNFGYILRTTGAMGQQAISQTSNVLYSINLTTGAWTLLSGNLGFSYSVYPCTLAFDPLDGNLYVSHYDDSFYNNLYRINGPAPITSPAATLLDNLDGLIPTGYSSMSSLGFPETPAGSRIISVSDAATVTEGNAGTQPMTFTVSLDQPASGSDVTVDFSVGGTVDAADVSGVLDGTLVFSAATGDQQKVVSVDVAGDTTWEVDETVEVLLSSPSSNGVLFDDSGVGQIGNDDAPVRGFAFGVDIALDGLFTFDPTDVAATASHSLFSNIAYSAEGGAFAGTDASKFYFLSFGTATENQLFSVDTTTNDVTLVGSLSSLPTDHQELGMCWDPASNVMRVMTRNSTSGAVQLHTLNLATAALTNGPSLGAPSTVYMGLACSDSGQVYSLDIHSTAGDAADALIAINKTTGAVTTVGQLGVDVTGTYFTDMDFDRQSGTLYWAGFDATGIQRLFTINTATGAATPVTSLEADALVYQAGAFAIIPPATLPTQTPSPTPTATPTATPSNTPSATPSPTPSNTPSPTPSNTPSPTPSNTPSPTPSNTPSPTASSTPSPTASNTPSPTPTAPPTATPSETPSPTPSATPSPTPRVISDYTFPTDAMGWTFLNVAPFFTAPTAGHSSSNGGVLTLAATNNTNTFGWWESPVQSLPSGLTAPVILSASYTLLSNQSDASIVPGIRLRSSAANSQQSDVMTIDSNGPSGLSPTTVPRNQTMYWYPAPGSPDFGLEFDLLNFDPADSATGSVSLDHVVLSAMPAGSFDGATTEKDFTFDSSVEGFAFHSLPGIFTAAVGSYDEPNGRLSMQYVPVTTGGFEFSWWGSSEDTNLISPTAGRLYIAEFTVESGESDATVVPGFRLRVNESRFQASQQVVVASTANGANSPTQGNPKTYRVVFPADAGVGGYLIFSFDSFAAAGDGDAETAKLFLTDLRVKSIAAP